jgi:hypothetical protein
MYWAIYLRKVNAPVTSCKWAKGYWSGDKYKRPDAFRNLEDAKYVISQLTPTLNDDETIELWENNEWHMPVRFLSAHAKTNASSGSDSGGTKQGLST